MIGRLAAAWNVPAITYGGTSTSLGNKTEFTTMTRLAYTMDDFARFYIHVFEVRVISRKKKCVPCGHGNFMKVLIFKNNLKISLRFPCRDLIYYISPPFIIIISHTSSCSCLCIAQKAKRQPFFFMCASEYQKSTTCNFASLTIKLIKTFCLRAVQT